MTHSTDNLSDICIDCEEALRQDAFERPCIEIFDGPVMIRVYYSREADVERMGCSDKKCCEVAREWAPDDHDN